jgi:hypothetical protein
MHNANIFLAQQRVLEARHRASEARQARRTRGPRPTRTRLERIRGAH